MTGQQPTPEAIEAVMVALDTRDECEHEEWVFREHDTIIACRGCDAVTALAFIRDAIHRGGADADAIRQALGFTRDKGHGVIVAGTILMSTYDGTGKDHERWRYNSPWREVRP